MVHASGREKKNNINSKLSKSDLYDLFGLVRKLHICLCQCAIGQSSGGDERTIEAGETHFSLLPMVSSEGKYQ